MLRKIIFILVCLITLVALVYVFENWRGKHAWESYKRAREAQGDSFEWSAILPPPVPDAENFAATPLFAELLPKPPAHPRLDTARLPSCTIGIYGDWHVARVANLAMWQACYSNDNLLAALSTYDPILNEITEASRRPVCRFPVSYEYSSALNALLPILGYVRPLVHIYRLRALAELDAGQTDAALADVRTSLRVANAVAGEPIIISYLVRITGLHLAIQPVWEGLAAHRWTESQLVTLQAEFERIDLFDAFAKAIHGERIFAYGSGRWLLEHAAEDPAAAGVSVPPFVRLANRVAPTGLTYQNILAVDRFYTETFLPAIDFEHHRVSPEAMQQVDATIKSRRTTSYNVLCKMMAPAVIPIPRKVALAQTAVDQATIACALERYRLAHQELPEDLAALVPQYLKQVPLDVITGQPLHYQRTASDRFILYSVGWNGIDDHGQIVMTGRNQDFDQGDWVWKSNP